MKIDPAQARLKAAIGKALELLEAWHQEPNITDLNLDDPTTVWEVCRVCQCRWGGHIEGCEFVKLVDELRAAIKRIDGPASPS
jgi:hypothetical protein